MNTRIATSFTRRRIVAAAVLAFALCSAHGAAFIVTNANDSGPGSLRSALTNANATDGTNTIQFNLSGTGVFVIAPLTSLPALTMPVILDGWSQPGWSNTPLVELNGVSVGAGYGLVLNTSNSLVRGLKIFGFQAGSVLIDGVGADGNRLQGNYFGAPPSPPPFPGNGSTNGIVITNGASGNLIGTDWDGTNDAAEGNTITYSTSCGVSITSSNCIQNRIWGNSFFQNGNRGIQLGTGATVTNGPAPGPNDFQNYPVIRGVYDNDSGPLILASLQSGSNQTYHLEFYSLGAAGQVLLGLTNVTTDSNGAATVVFPFAQWPSNHIAFMATATDASGNTSEFSPSFLIPLTPAITNVSPSDGNTAGGFVLTIQGGPFVAPCTVLLGGNECPVLDVSTSVIHCYAPAGAGAHQAVVAIVGSGLASNPFYFDYDFPAILTINPTYGSHAGGTVVTLGGSNFGIAAQVICGEFLAPVLTNTQTLIQFVTPPSAATNVPVTVILAGQSGPSRFFNYEPEGPALLGLANNGGLLTLQINQLTLLSQNYIETSTDLFNWFPFTNFVASSNSTSWTVPTSSSGQGFFRVLSQ